MVEYFEANRYLVQIDDGGIYLVDLDEFKSGFCSCRDFECRHLPKLIRLQECGIEDFPESVCKHLKYVKHYLKVKSQKTLEDHNKEGKR